MSYCTSEEVRREFPIGTRIETEYDGYLLKNIQKWAGTVVGYCRGMGSDKYIRVNFDGWKPQSNMAVDSTKIRKV